jgi:peptidyl-prolyl cis-trans isomerase C
MSKRSTLVVLLTIFIPLFLLSACNNARSESTHTPGATWTAGIPVETSHPTESPIPPTPTATQVPLAATVNGEEITLAEFQAELSRFQSSVTISGTILASDTNINVLNELIDQTLLAQAATENGFTVNEATLQTKINSLETALGDAKALDDWKTAHGYTDADFQRALKRSIQAAWMRDQIIGSVQESAEQVHVIHILFPTKEEADAAYTSLVQGADFKELARSNDPITGGDLGWFPRGYLNEPAIDEAVFSLQPEQYSTVINTQVGFQLFYVAEREANYPLEPDARRTLQVEKLRTWMRERRGLSEIQNFIQ